MLFPYLGISEWFMMELKNLLVKYLCDVAFAHSSSLKNHFESYAHVKKLKEKNSPNVLQTQLTKADYVAKDDFKGRSALKCAECDMEFSNYLGYR